MTFDPKSDEDASALSPGDPRVGAGQSLVASPEQSLAFLKSIDPDRNWALSAIYPSGKMAPRFKQFAKGQDQGLTDWVASMNAAGFNMYYALNPTVDTTEKASKDEVISADFLHVDIDARAGEVVAEELQRIQKLVFAFQPRANFIVMSGGGYQAIWRLDHSHPVDGENGSQTKLIESYNIALQLKLGGDNTQNIDRILRLPGTVNWPSARKIAKGRVPALAVVKFSCPAVTYALDQFPDPPQTVAAGGATPFVGLADEVKDLSVLVPYGLEAWVIANIERGDDIPALNALHDANGWPRAGKPYPSRSEASHAAICAMARRGVPPSIAGGLLVNPRFGIGAGVREQKNVLKAAQRAVSSAYQDAAQPDIERPDWPDVSKHGAPLQTYRNAYVAMKALGIVAEHDIFRHRLTMGGQAVGSWAGDVTDYTDTMLRQLLIQRFDVDFGKKNIHDAAIALCVENPINPVADYLDGVVWDGQPRIDRWLVDYFGVQDTPLNRVIGRKVLLAAVRRIREPGAKFDTVLVLEGKQGVGKTRALKILASEKYYSDATIFGQQGREQQEAVSGVWIYEIGEMAGLRKSTREMTKAFISRTHDRARPAYGTHLVDQARTCIFIGTTNDGEYLEDSTGNRRFWPVRVGTIDLAALARDRDQLWAEAALTENDSEALELPPELYAVAAGEQSARVIVHPWQDVLANVRGDFVFGEYRIWRSELYEKLGIDKKDQNATNSANLTAVMKALGWEGPKKLRIHKGLHPQWGFHRADDAGSYPDDGSDLPELPELPF
jgi:hypothetical protein